MPAQLVALGISLALTSPSEIRPLDLKCAAEALYWEATEAVMHVIQARAQDGTWGGPTICQVVYQSHKTKNVQYIRVGKKVVKVGKKICQFSFACLPAAKQRPRDLLAWADALEVARDGLAGGIEVDWWYEAARYYFNRRDSGKNGACWQLQNTVAIGLPHPRSLHQFRRPPESLEEHAALKLLYEPECKQPLRAAKARKPAPKVRVASK